MVEACEYNPTCDQYEPAVTELARGLSIEAYPDYEVALVTALKAVSAQCVAKHQSEELKDDQCLHRIEVGEIE